MADRGILFSGPMVRALLQGRKTQTRRLAPQPPAECSINYMLGNESWLPAETRTPVRRTFEAWGGPLFDAKPEKALCGSFDIVPRHQPDDRLYVREHWKTHIAYDDLAPSDMGGEETVLYLADGALSEPHPDMPERCVGRHRQAMHMPRWASRLWLSVTEVRVERLQNVSESDAINEGVEQVREHVWRDYFSDPEACVGLGSPVHSYATLWDTLHTEPGTRWQDNPWIYAITFDVNHGNIDKETPA